MTDEEFETMFFGNSKNMRKGWDGSNKRFLGETYEKKHDKVPKSFDWRDEGVVTPPKD